MTKILFLYFTISLLVLSFSCSNDDDPPIQQLSNLPLPGGLTDVWGFVDDTSNKEYAIVGFGGFGFGSDPNSGIYIVDVSDAKNPVQVSRLNTVPGFDVKVWQNFAYTVNGTSSDVGGIVDISDPVNPVRVGSFPSSHNIFIADNGYMYLETQRAPLRIYNLNGDPAKPNLVWSGGNDGHDATVIGNRWYDFGADGATNIFDVTNPSNPRLLTSINAPFISFHHSGWPTEDGRFLFICDELADFNKVPADFTVWDISNLDDPQKVGEFADDNATVHNLYIIGNFAYVSYYTAGFRVFDVSNPANPTLVDEFDTSQASGPDFDGAFGVYPFAPSGNIFVSDGESGLHIFSFKQGGLGRSRSNIVAP